MKIQNTVRPQRYGPTKSTTPPKTSEAQSTPTDSVVSEPYTYQLKGLAIGAAAGAVASYLLSVPLDVGLGLGAGLGLIGGSSVGVYHAHKSTSDSVPPIEATQYEWDEWSDYKGRRPGRAARSQSTSSYTRRTAAQSSSEDDDGLYLRSNLDWGFKTGQIEWSFSEGPRNTTLWPRRDTTTRIV
jgi:hypothetical protein